ncbi:hypothetical protein D3C80_551060 [compost metagenome]
MQRLVDAGIAEAVQVVQHQQQFAWVIGDATDQGDDRALGGMAVAAVTLKAHGIADHGGRHLGQAGQQVIEEPRQLVVSAGQGQPGNVATRRQLHLAPAGNGRGLAAACGPVEHNAAPAAGLEQLGLQALTGEDPGAYPRRRQLRAVDRAGCSRGLRLYVLQWRGRGSCLGIVGIVHGDPRSSGSVFIEHEAYRCLISSPNNAMSVLRCRCTELHPTWGDAWH